MTQKTLRTESGEVLEVKEGVVLNEDGSQSAGSSRSWILRMGPGGWLTGILAAFAIPAALIFGLFLLGGLFSLVAIFLLVQGLTGQGPKSTSRNV
jgi:hypothetical protein